MNIRDITVNMRVTTNYYSADQMKKNEIGGACGTYGRE